MTPERWAPVSRRLAEYDDDTLAIFVMPEDFFIHATGLPRLEKALSVKVRYLNGFISNALPSMASIPENKVAFVCGLGGVHSERGYKELFDAVQCLSNVKRVVPTISTHVWIGNNIKLGEYASKCSGIDKVYGINDCIRPNWSRYKVIFGRTSYNTFVEVMSSSKAKFITTHFESDGEWGHTFYEYIERFGIVTIPRFDRNLIEKAIVDGLVSQCAYDAIVERFNVFKDATSNLISIVEAFNSSKAESILA